MKTLEVTNTLEMICKQLKIKILHEIYRSSGSFDCLTISFYAVSGEIIEVNEEKEIGMDRYRWMTSGKMNAEISIQRNYILQSTFFSETNGEK